jgi:hypothetical protein
MKSDSHINGLAEFQKLKPTNPLESEDWITASQVLLNGGMHSKSPSLVGTKISWELLKEAFYKTYFPESVKCMNHILQ